MCKCNKQAYFRIARLLCVWQSAPAISSGSGHIAVRERPRCGQRRRVAAASSRSLRSLQGRFSSSRSLSALPYMIPHAPSLLSRICPRVESEKPSLAPAIASYILRLSAVRNSSGPIISSAWGITRITQKYAEYGLLCGSLLHKQAPVGIYPVAIPFGKTQALPPLRSFAAEYSFLRFTSTSRAKFSALTSSRSAARRVHISHSVLEESSASKSTTSPIAFILLSSSASPPGPILYFSVIVSSLNSNRLRLPSEQSAERRRAVFLCIHQGLLRR